MSIRELYEFDIELLDLKQGCVKYKIEDWLGKWKRGKIDKTSSNDNIYCKNKWIKC
jgi:hypothetical protein